MKRMKSALLMLCACVGVLLAFSATITPTYALNVEEPHTDLQKYVATEKDPYNEKVYKDETSEYGKRIDNYSILYNMTMFPKHDGQNGCGIVAMATLLQFYNELQNPYQGQYLPKQFNYAYSNFEQKERANALRDELNERTPKIFEPIWDNATMAHHQSKGMNSFLKDYCSNMNIKAEWGLLESDIRTKIDKYVPVMLTIFDYKYKIPNTENVYGEWIYGKDPHTVVAYGYRRVDGVYQYLCHLGWDDDTYGNAKAWVAPDLLPFDVGYCYLENAPLSVFNTAEVDGVGTNPYTTYTKIESLNCNFEGTLYVPNHINNYKVIVGENAFNNQTSITDIVFSKENNIIENGALIGCTSIVNLTLPVAKTISNLFGGTVSDSLKKVTISSGDIEDYTFRNCGALETVNLPNNATKVGAHAFDSCFSLTSINLPSNITSIGESAFYQCTSLTRINIPSKVTRIEAEAFMYCTSLKYVYLPNDLVYIGDFAFSSTQIKRINIPDNVTNIGVGAFNSCTALESVKLPSDLIKIKEMAFGWCDSLTTINLPDTLKIIDKYAFIGCSSLENIEIPFGVTFIGEEAFESCTALTEISIPWLVEEIGAHAFASCISLKNIDFGLGRYTIGVGAFRRCIALTEVDCTYCHMGNLPIKMFYECENLTKVILPRDLQSIGDHFLVNTAVESIAIPASVREIGEHAFDSSSLKTINVEKESEHFTDIDGVLYNSAKTELICIPPLIQGAITIPNGITSLQKNDFRSRSGLTAVVIPNSVSNIERDCFEALDNLTIYVESFTEAPTGWHSSWNSGLRPVVWRCIMSDDGSYLKSFVKYSSGLSNIDVNTVLNAPARTGYIFSGWAYQSDYKHLIEIIHSADGKIYDAIWVDEILQYFRFSLMDSGDAYSVGVQNGATLEGAIEIPQYFNGLPVKTIMANGFQNNISANGYAKTEGITSVTIPASVETIQNYAFA